MLVKKRSFQILLIFSIALMASSFSFYLQMNSIVNISLFSLTCQSRLCLKINFRWVNRREDLLSKIHQILDCVKSWTYSELLKPLCKGLHFLFANLEALFTCCTWETKLEHVRIEDLLFWPCVLKWLSILTVGNFPRPFTVSHCPISFQDATCSISNHRNRNWLLFEQDCLATM